MAMCVPDGGGVGWAEALGPGEAASLSRWPESTARVQIRIGTEPWALLTPQFLFQGKS